MTKLVCRLLDADDRLLGWCEHPAMIRGDGYLRASGPVVIEVTESGDPTEISIHWADVNVEIRVPFPQTRVSQSMRLTVFQFNSPMIQAGLPPVKRLPPVTVGAVSVSVPVGQLGAVGAAV